MRERGFTLLELMMTVAVAAILVVVGIPGMRSLVQNNRAAAASNSLVSALNLARSEALKRGTSVSVCASSDGASCSSDWAQGWIVATDSASGTTAPAPGTVIQSWEGLDGGASLSEANGNDFVRYQASGLSSAKRDFTLTIPDCTGKQGRKISISVTGRVSVQETACP